MGQSLAELEPALGDAWASAAENVVAYISNPKQKFYAYALGVIDCIVSEKVIPFGDLHARVAAFCGEDAKNVVETTIANTTAAVHGRGVKKVPDPGGWYFRDDKARAYVVERHFSAAWRKLRNL